MAALYPKNKLPLKEVKKFIILFYMVGFIGFLIPQTNTLFKTITPLALLLNTYLLAVYHEKYTKKGLLLFAIIYLLGFFIEVAGVQTGKIFGVYSYGSSLGPKLWDTPLMIGVNWLFLTYTSVAIVDKIKIKSVLSIFVAPALMLIYDLILEQVAPKLNMWSWANETIPIQNYMAWYIIALIFVAAIKAFKVKVDNKLATIIFLCQFIFFVLLTLFKGLL